MGTTQPIRKKEKLKLFLEYYQTEVPSERNLALLSLGTYTALRISDILALRWQDIYDFSQKCYKEHLFIREKKTGKRTVIALNPRLGEILERYRNTRNPKPADFVFTKATDYIKPLSRSQAFRIIKKAAENTIHEEHISCHSMRKTFGYQAWKQGTPPALLMDIYNHSSYRITKKYLGIEQDERDSLFLQLNFFG